jgi:hypothetical protein
VVACTDKLVVTQKTASYSNNYMLNAEKSLKKKLESTKSSTIEITFNIVIGAEIYLYNKLFIVTLDNTLFYVKS